MPIVIRTLGGNAKSFEFGSDVIGGKKYIISSHNELSQKELEDVSKIMNNRLYAVGYTGAESSIENGELIVHASSDQNISLLLSRGKIKGFVERYIMLSDNVGELQIGDESHTFSISGSNIEIGGDSYKIEGSIVLDGIQFVFSNVTNSSVVAKAIIFTNDDLRRTLVSSSFIKIDQNTHEYYYNVPAEVTFNSSERFSKVVEGLIPVAQFGGNALDGALVFTLDGIEISRMGIPVGAEITPLSTISIVDGGNSFRDATDKKIMIESSVEGVIEPNLSINSVEDFSGRFKWTISAASFVIFVCLFAIIGRAITLRKNRNIPIISGTSYLLIIFYLFGVAGFSQALLTNGWVIDRFSLLGISVFSVIITSQIIILLEKILKNRRFSKKYDRIIYAIYTIGFVSIFTNFSGFGIALIFGITVSYFVKSVYTDYINKFR